MRAEAIARRLMDGSASDDDDDTESLMDGDGEKLGGGGPEDCYVVAATGAGVTISSAKSLLHHYCNKLPSDKSAPLTLECSQAHHMIQREGLMSFFISLSTLAVSSNSLFSTFGPRSKLQGRAVISIREL